MKTETQFGYRFTVVNNVDTKTIGTGFFSSDKKMSEMEQANFLHKYTNGIYLKYEELLSIHIAESNE